MPILKPEGYRNDVPFFLKENLFNNPSSPVVAFGLDKTTHIEYERTINGDNFHSKLNEAKEKALKNLKQIKLNIQIQLVEGDKVAFISGHEYASEKILDKDFMIEVAKKIGAGDIMVGVPFKGHLIAADSSASIRAKFPAVIIKYYENPQQDVISPHVFLMRQGEIIGIGGSGLKEEEGTTFSISEDQNTHNYTVNAKCATIEELKSIVNTTYQQILLTIMKTSEFGGKITYHIDGELQDSTEFRERCKSFKDQISNNEMAQTLVSAFTKSSIETTFLLRGKLVDSDDSFVEETKSNAGPPPFIKENIVNTSPKSPKTDPEIAEEEDYSNYSVEELDQVFNKIVSVPNARTHVPSLIRMTKLMDAYENLGTTVPSERRIPRKKAKRPDNWGKTKSNAQSTNMESKSPESKQAKAQDQTPVKKWWQFWK